tara:strand:+ start:111 stop:428 length:318 start_codon:yes stop_codon:yes gene_type:complete
MVKKTYDMNRYRKVYPLIRRKPDYYKLAGSDSGVEANVISFTNSSEKKYTFVNEYIEIPICVISPENENVNVYITSLTTKDVTINASAPFTGNVHIHIHENTEDI